MLASFRRALRTGRFGLAAKESRLRIEVVQKRVQLRKDSASACTLTARPIDAFFWRAGKLGLEAADKALDDICAIPPWTDIHCDLDLLWRGSGVDHDTWRYNLHSLFILRHLIGAHRTRLDPAYLLTGIRIVRSWITSNPRMNPPSSFSWGEHTSANRAIGLCGFVDYLAHVGVELEIETLVADSLREHGRFLSDSDTYRLDHNHGIFQDFGLMVVATHIDASSLSDAWLSMAASRLIRQIDVQFSIEGIHQEGSTAYHIWITRLLEDIELYCQVVGMNIPASLASTITRAKSEIASLMMPDGSLAPIGDTWRGQRVSGTKDAPEHGLRLYPDAGFCVMTGLPYVFFMAESKLRHHGHFDDLSIIVADERGALITDPGFLNEQRGSSNRNYFVSRVAHNTFTSACEDPMQAPRWCGLESFGEAEGWMFCRARSIKATGEVHVRSLIRDQISGRLIIVDSGQSPVPVEWQRHFHFEPNVSIQINDGGFIRAKAGDGRDFGLLSWPADLDRCIVVGQTEPMLGWVADSKEGLIPAPTLAERTFSDRPTLLFVYTPAQEALQLRFESPNEIRLDDKDWTRTILLGEKEILIRFDPVGDPAVRLPGLVTIPLTLCSGRHLPDGELS